jgi:hypothetical protein
VDDEVEEAKKALEEAIERWVKVSSDPGDTLSGYILQVVTSNIDDLSRNWYSPLVRPEWQPYHATLGLVEFVYRNFDMPGDDGD